MPPRPARRTQAVAGLPLGVSRGGQRDSYSPAVQEKIRGGLAIGINVLAYATNRELPDGRDSRES